MEDVSVGINEYGNNQYYFEGEQVCAECLVHYTNSGVNHPIGNGTCCPTCQARDMVESYHDR